MPNLRESYAATEMASHAHSDLRETPIDRIAAAGWMNDLSRLVWKAQTGLNQRALIEAYKTLCVRYRSRYTGDDKEFGESIVTQAIIEWMKPRCPLCDGKRQYMADELLIICRGKFPDPDNPDADCGGVMRYTDKIRARDMNVSYAIVKRSSNKIQWVMEYISNHDQWGLGVMRQKLEKNVV